MGTTLCNGMEKSSYQPLDRSQGQALPLALELPGFQASSFGLRPGTAPRLGSIHFSYEKHSPWADPFEPSSSWVEMQSRIEGPDTWELVGSWVWNVGGRCGGERNVGVETWAPRLAREAWGASSARAFFEWKCHFLFKIEIISIWIIVSMYYFY